MAPGPLDLSDKVLPWTPVAFWQDGDYDQYSLVVALKAQPGLSDIRDSNGNVQTSVMLFPADGYQGWYIVVPDSTPQGTVEAGVAAYVLVQPPPIVDHASVTAKAMAQTIHDAVAAVADGSTTDQLRDAITASLAPFIA